MAHLKTYCKVTWNKEGELVDDEPTTESDFYYLLHFGLRYEIINNTVANYTVAICSNVKTGQIEMFDPSQIQIIGNEVRE